MGAYLRYLAAVSLAGLLLVVPSFALSRVSGRFGGAGGQGGVSLGRPHPGGGGAGSNRPGSRWGGGGTWGRPGGFRGNDYPWSPWGPGGGFPYGGMNQGYSGYGDFGGGSMFGPESGIFGDLYPELPLMIPPEVPTSKSVYRRVDGVLYQYDLEGNLIQATPLPQKSWPRGGEESLAAMCRTGGYWAGRLRGPAGDETTAKGTITFWLEDNCELRFQLEVRNLRHITGAYVYLTDPNIPLAAAPAVAPLYTGRRIPGEYCGTLAEGTMLGSNLMGWFTGHPIASLVQALDDRQIVVRIATARHPAGELEGVVGRVLLVPPTA